MLLTIAGSSCSGKTTAARACAGVSRLVVHDFDEIGVPSTADTRWRHRSMDAWLRRVLGYQDDGLDVLLTGQSPLGEVLATPPAVYLNGIAACLLDVADDERLCRLQRRDPGSWQPRTPQSLIGWAQWHRAHAANPRYRPDVLIGDGWEQMQWERWCNWLPDDPRWDVTIIDTRGKQSSRPRSPSSTGLLRHAPTRPTAGWRSHRVGPPQHHRPTSATSLRPPHESWSRRQAR